MQTHASLPTKGPAGSCREGGGIGGADPKAWWSGSGGHGWWVSAAHVLDGEHHLLAVAANVEHDHSRMLGGSATPRVWNSLPAQPVVGVRRMKRLPSCSTSTSLEAIQIAQHFRPFGLEAPGGAAIGELLLQHKGEERAEHVAADGGITFVEDRPRGEQRLSGLASLVCAPNIPPRFYTTGV
jgi:hypothetical protein